MAAEDRFVHLDVAKRERVRDILRELAEGLRRQRGNRAVILEQVDAFLAEHGKVDGSRLIDFLSLFYWTKRQHQLVAELAALLGIDPTQTEGQRLRRAAHELQGEGVAMSRRIGEA